MNKHVVIFALLFGVCSTSYGQSFIGAEGTLNRANVFSINIGSTKNRISTGGGVAYDRFFGKHWALGTGISYSPRGFKQTIYFTDENNEPLGKSNATFNFNYLQVPIKLSWYIGDKIFGFVQGGVVPGYLLHDVAVLTGNSSFTGKNDATSYASRFDVAGMIGIGWGVRLANNYMVFTSLSYQRSVTDISNSKYFSGTDMKTLGESVTLGVKRKIGKL